MQPKTLSASSLSNWEDCPAKFAASNLEYVPESGKKEASKVGTAVHYALEHFVRDVYMNKTHEWSDQKHLLALYFEGYKETFHSADKKAETFKDGLKLTKAWHKRTDLEGWEIDNVEEKKRYPIGNTGILFTYIFDRVMKKVDENGRRILWVTDYKSIRRTYTIDELENAPQMRLYGLMAAIEYREWQPDEIWVELDLLRYSPVSIMLRPEDNLETLEYLCDTTKLIQAADVDDLPRTLGAGCRFCPVSATCEPLQKNIEHGGVASITDLDEIGAMRFQLNAQREGLEALVGELDAKLQAHAEEHDLREFTAGGHPVKMSAQARRGLTNTAEAADIVGPEVMKMFGKLNVGDVDKILDSDLIDEERKARLLKLIGKSFTRPSVKVAPIPALDKEGAA